MQRNDVSFTSKFGQDEDYESQTGMMSEQAVSSDHQSQPFAWVLFLLLLSSIGINYVDRGALAIATPSLQAELHLSSMQIGWLLSAFFWTYACTQPMAGWLLDRYGTKRIFAMAFLMWSLATASVGIVHSFPLLLVARLVLGAGESVAYPAYSKIFVEDFSHQRRGLLNSLLDAASKCGPAASTMLGALLIARFGWRMLFLSLGVVGLLWLGPWIRFGPKSKTLATLAAAPSSIGKLLSYREVWFTSLGMFCLGYGWFFLVSWLPAYLSADRHLSLKQIGAAGSIPFWSMAIVAIACGWYSDRLVIHGYSSNMVRRSFVTLGFGLSGLFLAASALVREANASVVLLVLTCVALGMATSNLWAITQTLAGRRYSGAWTGIQNAVGNMGGVVSPLITGYLISRTGNYQSAILVAAALFFLGALIYCFGLSRVEELEPWEEKALTVSR